MTPEPEPDPDPEPVDRQISVTVKFVNKTGNNFIVQNAGTPSTSFKIGGTNYGLNLTTGTIANDGVIEEYDAVSIMTPFTITEPKVNTYYSNFGTVTPYNNIVTPSTVSITKDDNDSVTVVFELTSSTT